MSEKNQSQSTQLSFTIQAILLLLFAIIGIQIWYMLEMKKQLDAIQAEHVLIQPSAQETSGKNEAAVVAIDRPAIAENRTEQVQEEQVAQKIPPKKSDATPAAPAALPKHRPSNSSNQTQTRAPYEVLQRMQRDMERAFNNRQNAYKRPDFEYQFRQDFSVPEMDVREDDRQYIIRVNIPGADERNVSVKLEGQRLTVRGKQRQQQQSRDDSGSIIFSQRQSGSFQRSITLYAAVEERGMKTRIDNGVLTIIIPKK